MTQRTKALCQGSTLTASFGTADPPLIWRFDLERNHSFTLALQGESGDWDLGVTSPKGEFYSVVHFAVREDAEEAFAAVGKALSRRNGVSVGTVGRAVLVTVLAALIIAGGVVGFGLYVRHHTQSTAIGEAPPLSAGVQEGVPLSADDVLKPPPL